MIHNQITSCWYLLIINPRVFYYSNPIAHPIECPINARLLQCIPLYSPFYISQAISLKYTRINQVNITIFKCHLYIYRSILYIHIYIYTYIYICACRHLLNTTRFPQGKGLLRQRVAKEHDAVPVRGARFDLGRATAHGWPGAKGADGLLNDYGPVVTRLWTGYYRTMVTMG